jgi:hypothetical protein
MDNDGTIDVQLRGLDSPLSPPRPQTYTPPISSVQSALVLGNSYMYMQHVCVEHKLRRVLLFRNETGVSFIPSGAASTYADFFDAGYALLRLLCILIDRVMAQLCRDFLP